jgi:hypothetical protein
MIRQEKVSMNSALQYSVIKVMLNKEYLEIKESVPNHIAWTIIETGGSSLHDIP